MTAIGAGQLGGSFLGGGERGDPAAADRGDARAFHPHPDRNEAQALEAWSELSNAKLF